MPTVYVCKYCGKEFDSIQALGGHIRMSHPRRRRSKKKAPQAQQGSASSANTERRLSINNNSEKAIIQFYEARSKLSSLINRFEKHYKRSDFYRVLDIEKKYLEEILQLLDSALRLLDPNHEIEEKWRKPLAEFIDQLSSGKHR